MQQVVHDDCNFEFLGLAGDVHEGRIERSLILRSHPTTHRLGNYAADFRRLRMLKSAFTHTVLVVCVRLTSR